MIQITDEAVKGLQFDFKIDDRVRSILVSHCKTEGFDTFQRLMEQEIRRLNLKLMNTPAHDQQEVIANHAVAKGAAQFYIGFMQRLQELIQIDAIIAQGIGTLENPEQVPLEESFN